MTGLKFRVLLDSNQNQEVFRDILVDKEHTFETFYHEIMRSFQFEGNQMASFYVSNDDWDKGHEISWMDLSYGDDQQTEFPSVMATSKISDFIEEHDQKFILVYDFMRMWIFLIELISTNEIAPETPTTVLSIGIAPAEDSKQMTILDAEEDYADESDDDFGFDDFDDGMDEEDLGGFEQYDY
ncbi:MAG: plasmid pRiA4b ORF-3 family protein [Bacteroidetes bacterium]|nr:plasmid pRiA4b ORF-3 family protein [Bacteroidota bacterium]